MTLHLKHSLTLLAVPTAKSTTTTKILYGYRGTDDDDKYEDFKNIRVHTIESFIIYIYIYISHNDKKRRKKNEEEEVKENKITLRHIAVSESRKTQTEK